MRHVQEPAVRPGTFQFAASPKRVAQVRQIPETAAEAHRAALLVQVRARRGQALRSGRTALRFSQSRDGLSQSEYRISLCKSGS